MIVRQRPSSRELVMDRQTFARADFGRVCQQLGLRPSEPNRSADGKRRRPKRKAAAK